MARTLDSRGRVRSGDSHLSPWRQNRDPRVCYRCGVAEAGYTFQAAAPVFSPGPATRYSPLDVTITCATPGAQIRYTTNGADPTKGSPLYTGPIHIDGTMTIKARAWNSGWTPSDITSGLYTLKVYAPIFSPAGGTFTSPVNVSMSCESSQRLLIYVR